MIDWKRVISLRDEVGETEFRPLVELFLDEIEGAIMGINVSDADALRKALHFMKGCGLNMGLTGFCFACDSWETALDGDAHGFPQADILLESYSTSKQALMRDIERMTRNDATHTGAA